MDSPAATGPTGPSLKTTSIMRFHSPRTPRGSVADQQIGQRLDVGAADRAAEPKPSDAGVGVHVNHEAGREGPAGWAVDVAQGARHFVLEDDRTDLGDAHGVRAWGESDVQFSDVAPAMTGARKRLVRANPVQWVSEVGGALWLSSIRCAQLEH